MHYEVANTIFFSWCFVASTGIIRSNSLIQVESVAEPPTAVSTDMYVELSSFPRLSYRLIPPPFADVLHSLPLPLTLSDCLRLPLPFPISLPPSPSLPRSIPAPGFRYLIGEGTGTARPESTFNRFALKLGLVGFVVYILTSYYASFWSLSGFSFNTYILFAWIGVTPVLDSSSGQHVKESFCSFLPERLLAPGTSTFSTATPCASTNQDDCYPGEPWLHVKFYLLTIRYAYIAFASIQIALSPSFFNPEVRSRTRSSISYMKVLMRKFVTCDHELYLIPHKVNAYRVLLRSEKEHTWFRSTVRV